MGAVQYMFALALRPLLDGIGRSMTDPSARAEEIRTQLAMHLDERRVCLTRALQQANESAWQSLEVALAGEPLYERIQVAFRRAGDEACRRQVRTFLDASPLATLAAHGPEFRHRCLEEVRQAYREGHLTPAEMDLSDLLKKAADCLRPSDPEDPGAEDEHALQRMAEQLRQLNYPTLSELVGERVEGASHVVAQAAGYFFRRAIEAERDPILAAQLADVSTNGNVAALAALADALPTLAEQLDDLLNQLGQPSPAVSDGGPDLNGLEGEALELLERRRLANRPMRPGDCLAFADDEESAAAARAIVARVKELPDGVTPTPALREAVGVLQFALGQYDGALQDFQIVSRDAADNDTRAHAHWNAYQVALVQSLWSEALEELKKAIELAPQLYTPFPSHYRPERVLGVGGFGVSFLCHAEGGERVVVKALRTDWIDRSLDEIFRELRALKEVDHPGLLRVIEFGVVDEDPERPYVVMEYFDGSALSFHVAQHGPLTASAALPVARALAETLHAVHACGAWHRHLNPGNILVRLDDGQWTVRLADFGLGLRPGVVYATMGNPLVRSHTIVGRSVTGMIDFAAPEQLGLLDGVEAGPEVNIYNFGRLGYYLLLGNPIPDDDEKDALPESWRKFLGQCVARTPEKRPAGTTALLQVLAPPPESTPTAPEPDSGDSGTGLPRVSITSESPLDSGIRLPLPAAPATATTPDAPAAPAALAVPKDARGFHDRGLAYASKGAYDKAITDLNRALELDPQFASALTNRGEMFRLKGDLERAFADFTQALRVDPKHAPAFLNRGRVFRLKGRIDRALNDFTQAHRLDPKNADVLVNRGNAFSDAGQQDKAIADYTDALKLDPNLALAYMNRGLAHAKKGDFGAVITDCAAAIKLNGKLVGAYFIRGAAHASNGEHDKAIADFTRVLALDPAHALAHNDRGLALANKGEYDKAISDYNRALRRDPKLTLAYMNRAIAYRLKGEHDKAIAEFTKMLRLSPKNVLAYTNRGLAYLAKKDYDRAIADFTEALWIDPSCTEAYTRRVEAGKLKGEAAKVGEERRNRDLAARDEKQRRQERATAHFTRAQMHFDNGNFDKAVADYTEALKHDPKDAFTCYHRGLAHAANEDYDKALADYTEAVRLNPKLAVAYYHRGVGYRLRGNFARAIADFTEAIRLDPKYALAFRNRGLAFAALGEQTKAKGDYDEAIKLDATLARR
jgi:tetratricopeptide (TPR) repeat protein